MNDSSESQVIWFAWEHVIKPLDKGKIRDFFCYHASLSGKRCFSTEIVDLQLKMHRPNQLRKNLGTWKMPYKTSKSNIKFMRDFRHPENPSETEKLCGNWYLGGIIGKELQDIGTLDSTDILFLSMPEHRRIWIWLSKGGTPVQQCGTRHMPDSRCQNAPRKWQVKLVWYWASQRAG